MAAMITFQQLDKALKARGWRYDIGQEQFIDANGKAIRDRKLTALVRGMTLDELASYQDDKYDKGPTSVRAR